MKISLSNWLLDSASRWMRNALGKHADEAWLQTSGEVERIAQDLNLSVSELHALCAKDSGSAKLLQRRMSHLHLDKNEIKRTQPGVARDLEKVCALCESDAKCSHDLDRNPARQGWTEYCPNAPTLQQLQQEAPGQMKA